LVSAGFSLLGVLAAPIVAEAAKGDSPPSASSCLDLQQQYYAAVHSGADRRQAILGPDGKSGYLAADPQAQACRITADSVK